MISLTSKVCSFHVMRRTLSYATIVSYELAGTDAIQISPTGKLLLPHNKKINNHNLNIEPLLFEGDFVLLKSTLCSGGRVDYLTKDALFACRRRQIYVRMQHFCFLLTIFTYEIFFIRIESYEIYPYACTHTQICGESQMCTYGEKGSHYETTTR
uniref:Uncharacterized protein n=1 Tax=Glossina palpalis gambiensis TaxID=67801 RepID=A0A1B0B4B8_9MUSC